MEQYTLSQVKSMTFAQLGEIDDPMLLMATGALSPMLVRYAVKTGQLERRFPAVSMPTLLDAIDKATLNIDWNEAVGQFAPVGERNEIVDGYLDRLQDHAHRALRPN